MERAFKGVWIPKEIWLDKDLNWVEKVLLVEIDSLDNDEGCWASNSYFADFFNLSKNRISILISSLSKKGYISVDIKYKEGTKQVDKRIIKNKHTYMRKQKGGIGENEYTPICENAKENNTVFNNTDDSSSSKENPYQLYQELFGVLNPINQENITKWIEDLSEELVVEAMKKAALDNKPYSYAEGILKQWDKHNIKTLEDVKARETSFANNYSQNKSNARKRLENSGSSEYDDLF
ncbi:DnaD domain protein [Tetragenococcus halophilus]|uniref:DnaD domain protein n=1 Tax=Tetragenococcus halophilus TaxID=51669 RepID=UPI0030EFEAD3